MPRYHYEVIDPDGMLHRGDVEEETQESLADSLQQKGLIIISITRYGEVEAVASGLKDWFDRTNKRMLKGSSVKLSLILQFTNQLSSMVGAGLHLLRVLTSLSEDTKNKTFQYVLQEVKRDIEGGEAFSEALAKHPKIFSEIYVNLVRAAEATGEMDTILTQLAKYLDKTLGLRRKVKSALTYPAAVLVIAMIAIMILIVKIVPTFERTFTKLGAELPLPTQILIAISNVLRNYFIIAAAGLAGVLFILWRFFRTERGSYVWDAMMIKMPLFGPLIFKTVLARFLSTLALLMQSGVSLLEAFQLAGKACGNKVIQKAAYTCMDDIREGRPIFEAMEKVKIFPDIVLRMVSSGEEAGTLPDMLSKVTVYFEEQVEASVESLSSLIEPILILFLGTIIGAIIVSVFLPIFRLGEAVKKGMR